jgi:hypothetical protein
MAIYALKDIQKDAEITVAYVSPLAEYSKRKETLSDSWGFCCQCRLCTLDASDENYEKRASYIRGFEAAMYSSLGISSPTLLISSGEHILEQVIYSCLLVRFLVTLS